MRSTPAEKMGPWAVITIARASDWIVSTITRRISRMREMSIAFALPCAMVSTATESLRATSIMSVTLPRRARRRQTNRAPGDAGRPSSEECERSVVPVTVAVTVPTLVIVVVTRHPALLFLSRRSPMRMMPPVPGRHRVDRARHVARLDDGERAAVIARPVPVVVVVDVPVHAVVEHVVRQIVIVVHHVHAIRHHHHARLLANHHHRRRRRVADRDIHAHRRGGSGQRRNGDSQGQQRAEEPFLHGGTLLSLAPPSGRTGAATPIHESAWFTQGPCQGRGSMGVTQLLASWVSREPPRSVFQSVTWRSRGRPRSGLRKRAKRSLA